MTLEEFNKLSDEEKQLELEIANEEVNKKLKELSDLKTERESLKKELDEVNKLLDGNKKELQATKELNYTLARKVDASGSKKSFEETLHDIFSKKEETKK